MDKMKNLTFDYPNAWKEADNELIGDVFAYCDDYKEFISKVKTEREFVKYALCTARENGFIDIEDVLKSGDKLTPGMKVYKNIHNKAFIMAVIGSDDCAGGFNLVGAHVDSPRLDFKQNPIYEDSELVLAKTHYYGGIKKYQWLAIPLAIHGVVIKKDGSVIDIAVGEDDKEPAFTITDLLPHLAAEQMQKKLGEAIPGENLNIILGSIPLRNEDADEANPFKKNVLRLLFEKYDITEADFISAELELVPAFKARDLGIDRSLIGAYGHDDRVCAYPALTSITCIKEPKRTAIAYFSDKEEIGSMGNTGAQSKELENFIAYLCSLMSDNYSDILVRRCISASSMLSADVNSAVDPNFEGVMDKLNASRLSKGMVMTKYTGSRGKSGSSDANPEFIARLRAIFDDNGVIWQTGELGKVDQGGGGTIAQYMANLGMQVVDCGIPILSMHSPFEVASKIDIYYTAKAYNAFFSNF